MVDKSNVIFSAVIVACLAVAAGLAVGHKSMPLRTLPPPPVVEKVAPPPPAVAPHGENA